MRVIVEFTDDPLEKPEYTAQRRDGVVTISLPKLLEMKRNKQTNELGRIMLHELILAGVLEREY